MLKHMILVECRAKLLELKIQTYLNFGLDLKTKIKKGLIFYFSPAPQFGLGL